MAQTTTIAFLAAFLSILLNACASSGVGVPADETYRGQLAAAVAPPAGAGRRAADMQRRLQTGIEAAGIFASVIALDSPRERNEAEVIIVPAVLEAQSGGRGLERLKLAVRASRKSNGTVGIDKVYNGRASGRGDALDDVLKILTKDLKREYREPPVY